MRMRGRSNIANFGSNPIVKGNVSAVVEAHSPSKSPSGNYAVSLQKAPRATERLVMLTAFRDSSAAKKSAAMQGKADVYEGVLQAKSARENYIEQARQLPVLDPDQYTREVAAHDDAIARARAAHDAIARDVSTVASLAISAASTETRVKKFLNQHRGGALADFSPGVDHTDSLAVLSVRVYELQQARDTVESAPPPYDEALAKLLREFNAKAEKGRPRVMLEKRYMNHDRVRQVDKFRTVPLIGWPIKALEGVAAENAQSGEMPEIEDAAALLAFLHADELRNLIAEDLRRVYERYESRTGAAPLPSAERKARLAAIDDELMLCERMECELVWREAATGVPPVFRNDCSVLAILGVA